ncbi:hypothetical protein KCMC57_up63290 [Kitasatospora sp. CMC57]|uniref:Uncharacterized protein n=2 Tax=Kitasatospora sp. CMC57 TaxID=3231513 RepID=A0AB33K2Y9_9ACTN
MLSPTRPLPVDLFSAVVALTVAIAEDPWLPASTARDSASDWRRLPIPHSRGLVEYVIDSNTGGHGLQNLDRDDEGTVLGLDPTDKVRCQ